MEMKVWKKKFGTVVFFHALPPSNTAWMEFTESHSLKIHRLRTAKQLHGLHSALTTLCSFTRKPTAGAPINSTVLSHVLEKNNLRTGKVYPLQEGKVKCWPLYSAHIKYSEREMSALKSAPKIYYHLFIFNTNPSVFQPTGRKADTAGRYFILIIVGEAQQLMCYWHRTIYLNKHRFWFFLTLERWWKRVWGACDFCLVCVVPLLFQCPR